MAAPEYEYQVQIVGPDGVTVLSSLTGSTTGNVAHDSPDSGNPVKIGARAVDPAALPTDVQVGDRVDLIADLKGRLLAYLSTALDSAVDSVTASLKSGTKGSSAAAAVTSTASGANHQPLDVLIYDASGNPIVSFGGGTQYADGAAAATPTGTAVNWNEAGTQRTVSATKPLPVSDSKLPALGAAISANSIPVTLSSDGQFAVNFGAQADTAATTDTGSFSFLAFVKRLLGKFTMDSTDRIRMSMYGKSSAAGDTPLLLTSNGSIQGNMSSWGGGLVNGAQAPSDGLASTLVSPGMLGFVSALNGATWDRLRTPNTFKTASATASGDTAAWTPAAGKKFRVMGYSIEVTGEATLAAPGDLTITLRDATTDLLLTHTCYIPSMGGVAGTLLNTGTVQLGNGKLSSAANAVLNVNLSAALTAGVVRISTFGVEE